MHEHDGQYHKGYLTKRNCCYWFLFESHVNKQKEDWGVDLPSLVMNWVDLCSEGVLIPGHVSHMFLRCCLPQLLQPLILWLLLSAQSTFTLNAGYPFSRCLPTHILTVRYGSAVSLRKSMASRVSTHTAKSPWANIVLFARKELPRPFRRCVS